jgi:sugar lactone lactonase YvrE
VQDTCGNFYELENGGNLLELPANGGAAIYLVSYGSGVSAGDGLAGGLAIDSSNNLYVGHKWSGEVIKIPSTNCTPNPAQQSSVLNNTSIGSIDGYWYDPGDIATDAAGDLFVVSNGFGGSGKIFEQTSSTTGAVVLTSGPAQTTSLAVDSSGNVFFTVAGSGTVYEVPKASYGTSSPTAVITSGLTTALGISFDTLGNMYVGDTSTGSIYVIPFTTSLQFGKMYLFASGLPLGTAITMSKDGKSLLYADFGASVYEQVPGSANFGSVAVGSTGTATVNVVFNASESPASISLKSGGAFSSTGGTCAAGSYTAGQSCTITAQFAPGHPGISTGGITLADASNNVLATAYLQGTGLGAGLTLDSGTVTALGSGFTTPQSIATTPSGGFIVDSGANKVLYFATPTSSPVLIGSGLKAPLGVAVDGAGNVFIADTGNNQIIEVPVVNGTLSNSAQVTIVSSTATISGTALSSPAGITVDGQGNLYIADTGNNRIAYLPYNGSWNVTDASVIGSGFKAPLATTVDSFGNLYVADSGNGQIDELVAPVTGGNQKLVAVGYSNPSALATDASGSLFVVDQGADMVFRIPNVAGSLNPNAAIEVGFGVAAPYGLTVDSTGNLYVTDPTHASVSELNRISPTELFGDWALGAPSSVLPVKVENEGNQTLNFGTPFYTASGNTGDFSLGAPSGAETDCADGGTVAAGDVCEMDAVFTPAQSGTRTDTLTLQSNAQNTSSAQVILQGVGSAASATTTVLAKTSPSGTASFGQAITLTATVTSTGGTPSGSAQLLVDGVITGEATLSSSGVATFSLPMGLTGGSHALQAAYLGATSFAGSTSSVLTVAVSTAPTASAMAITSPYTNPYSALSSQLVEITPITNPVTYNYVSGGSVTFTVAIGFAGVGIPTGTVTFATGGTTLGTASVVPAAGGVFQATFTTVAGPPCVVSTSVPTCPAGSTGAQLPVGTDLITATYSGDANYVGSATSGTVIVVSSATLILSADSSSIINSGTVSSAVNFTEVSEGGWTGIVGYSCDTTTLPANTRCIWSPGQAQVMTNSVSPTVTLRIAVNQPPQTPIASKLIWWIGTLTGLMLFFTRRRMMSGAWATVTMLIGLVLLGVSATALTACGNNGIQNATPTGATTITVYASADPFTTAPSSSTPTPTTQSCGLNATTKMDDPTLAPCSQKSYKISLTVQ